LARLLIIVLAVAVTFPAAAGPSEGRARELINLLRQDCGSCHGLTLKGGLGPPLLPAELADRDNSEIAEVIMNGRPGTPMPPWRFELDNGEALWMAGILKEGLK